MNTDQVSSIEYKPVSTRLDIEFFLKNMEVSTYPARARITLFRVKPISLEGTIDCSLPSRLGAYRNMSSNAGDSRSNYFTPRLHEVIYDRKIAVTVDTANPKRRIAVSIPYTFKTSHVCRPDFTNLPAGQVFVSAMPQSEIIWCLISVNDALGTKWEDYGLKIRRSFKWRDRDGIQG